MINIVLGDKELLKYTKMQPCKVGREDVVATDFEYLLTQYDLRQGLKMYGECGEKTAKMNQTKYKEQMHQHH